MNVATLTAINVHHLRAISLLPPQGRVQFVKNLDDSATLPDCQAS
jgi:hypothetical protein